MSVTYNHGDIVWVKLHSHWWPGEVIHKSQLPKDITFKKDPIAIVGFFGEDSYECVQKESHIMFYTCGRKNEFIKRGMAAYRAKQKNMETFPKQVCTAESLIANGNPNILSDPEFGSQKRENYAATLFGTPSPRKSPRGGVTKKAKGRTPIKKKAGSSTNSEGVVTHRRFLGYNDHEVRILIQEPKQDENSETQKKYDCSQCRFTTSRIQVFMLHKKSHIQGVYTNVCSSSPKKKTIKIPRTGTSTIEEDLALIEKGLPLISNEQDYMDDDDDEDEEMEEDTPPEPPVKKVPEPKKSLVQDVAAEWDEDDEEEEEETIAVPKKDVSIENKQQNEEPKKEEEKKKTDESCFDFSEEEEETEVVKATTGRKIPRVIPVNDKPKSTESLDTDDIFDTLKENEQKEISEADKKEEEARKAELENIQNAFEELIESTAPPTIPELPPNILKCEQNFHDVRTVKVPDKQKNTAESPTIPNTKLEKEETKSQHEVATKLTNPKKRFVKSFEDLEMKKIAQQRETDEIKESKSEPPQIDQTKKAEEEAKETKEEKLADDSESSLKEVLSVQEICSPSQNATPEISSPSKRVTSIYSSPSKNVTREYSSPSKTRTAKISSPSKQSPESLEPLKSVSSEKVLQVSKLKTQLMSKMNTINITPQETSPKSLTTGDNETSHLKYRMKGRTRMRLSPRKSLTEVDAPSLDSNTSDSLISSVESGDTSNAKDATIHMKPETPSVSEENQKSEEKEKFATDESKVDETSTEVSAESKTDEILNEVLAEESKPDEILTEVSAEKSKTDEVLNDVLAEKSKTDEILTEVLAEKSKIGEILTEVSTEISKTDEILTEVSAEKSKTDDTLTEDLTEKSKTDETLTGVLSEKSRTDEVLTEVSAEKVKTDEIPAENKSEKILNDVFAEKQETIDKAETSTPEKAEVKKSALDVDESIPEQPPENQEIPRQAEEHKVEESVEENKSPQEDISALSTLAAVSEMTSVDPFSKHNNVQQPELIAIDKNVTIVTEKELADGQVEFANNTKPLTLSNFSLDFSDTNSGDVGIGDVKVPSLEEKKLISDKNQPKSEKKKIAETSGNSVEIRIAKVIDSAPKPIKAKSKTEQYLDVEEEIPPMIVCTKESVESEIAKISNSSASSEPEFKPISQISTSTKLLDILTDAKNKHSSSRATKEQKILLNRDAKANDLDKNKKPNTENIAKTPIPKPPKFITKSIMKTGNKPTILSERIIKPTMDTNISVQKVTSKRTYQDVEDIDTFIIQKPPKKMATSEVETTETKPIVKKIVPPSKAIGKAKIIQQTIITPTGDIIHPDSSNSDDNMFDINSMPIVLSDQILTPENIDSVPIVLSDTLTPTSSKPAETKEKPVVTPAKKVNPPVKLLNKGVSQGFVKTTLLNKTPQTPTFVKTYAAQNQKIIKNQKVYQVSPKIVKSSPAPAIITQTGKPGKFLIVPQGTPTSGSKINIEKRIPITKRLSASGTVSRIPNVAPEPTGNKIMIVTNQQGEQSRLLLTPAQQKLLGYQSSGTKIRTTLKGGVQKSVLTKGILQNIVSKSPNIIAQTKGQMIGGANIVTTSSQLLTTLSSQQLKGLKGETPSKTTKKLPIQSQKVLLQTSVSSPKTSGIVGPRTVVKSPFGQTVKKLQPIDDALLDKQVQEQLQAINKASGIKIQQKVELPSAPKPLIKPQVRRSYVKKPVITEPNKPSPANAKPQVLLSAPAQPQSSKSEASLPPLAPISPPKKTEQPPAEPVSAADDKTKSERPVNQLIIQDALGNQTTITEGQILALPSETVDGQPQSYMLVTLDESGNLAPLNNEALMSLDPNLGLGGDLSNIVLQIDSGNGAVVQQTGAEAQVKESPAPVVSQPEVVTEVKEVPAIEPEGKVQITPEVVAPVVTQPDVKIAEPELPKQNVEISPDSVACAVSGDPNQQFVVTGDPVAAQKLIESLTEGNADLASILASAENGSILIQADGQQILINADSDNQMLLSVNTENLNISESSGASNPIFAQPTKSQDILAAALADTDVFQQDQSSTQSKVTSSQLSPNSALYPMNVGSVLETSLTLSSPIMTPLEVPSTNNKKIADDETDILTQVPKNVDLPITITDPNISQTVSQQQVASMIANELNELPLSIADPTISVASSGLNSPSYVYSLPVLDETVELNPKPFGSSMSMPLLNDDSESGNIEEPSKSEEIPPSAVDQSQEIIETVEEKPKELPTIGDPINEQTDSNLTRTTSFIEEEEGLCTLGGEMCSSLSEPPPDMFDISIVDSSYMNSEMKQNTDIPEVISESNEDKSSIENQSPLDADGDKFSSFGECRNGDDGFNPTVDSELSSSALNVDENSCEIPVQPTIDYCETSQNSNESVKRSFDSEEDDNAKRLKVD